METTVIWKPKFLGPKLNFNITDLYWASKHYSAKLDAVLIPLGFERTGKRLWVNSANAPFRRIVELSAHKGATDTLRWGYSFDFCPLTDNHGTKVIWARTPKSARPMLSYDPSDYWDEKKRDFVRFFLNEKTT
jgi:hypothetical protein